MSAVVTQITGLIPVIATTGVVSKFSNSMLGGTQQQKGKSRKSSKRKSGFPSSKYSPI
jgi:hypothetical protein